MSATEKVVLFSTCIACWLYYYVFCELISNQKHEQKERKEKRRRTLMAKNGMFITNNIIIYIIPRSLVSYCIIIIHQ